MYAVDCYKVGDILFHLRRNSGVGKGGKTVGAVMLSKKHAQRHKSARLLMESTARTSSFSIEFLLEGQFKLGCLLLDNKENLRVTC